MKKMLLVAAVMALTLGSQLPAEARGGGGGGMGGGAGMTSMRGGGLGQGDMLRTHQQDRLRDCTLSTGQAGSAAGDQLRDQLGDKQQDQLRDQLGDKQQDRLRDPALHTDTVVADETAAE